MPDVFDRLATRSRQMAGGIRPRSRAPFEDAPAPAWDEEGVEGVARRRPAASASPRAERADGAPGRSAGAHRGGTDLAAPSTRSPVPPHLEPSSRLAAAVPSVSEASQVPPSPFQGASPSPPAEAESEAAVLRARLPVEREVEAPGPGGIQREGETEPPHRIGPLQAEPLAPEPIVPTPGPPSQSPPPRAGSDARDGRPGAPVAPVVHVHIGRVEVRAQAPEAPPRGASRPAPRVSLDEYLARANGKPS